MPTTTSHRILTYADLLAVPAGDSPEPLVDVRTYDATILAEYEKFDMEPYTDGRILVRDSVAERLSQANQEVARHGYALRVVYGYRHPEVQQRYFTNRKEQLRRDLPAYTEQQLDTLTHNFVAVPDVAGHPTGGAVDLTLVAFDGTPCAMGTDIADYIDPEKIKTFSAGLTKDEMANRAILCDAMMKAGFAPFYGEWWHFSYGDREWAAFYGQPAAQYGQTIL